MSGGKWPSAICPCTGLAIPECSCRRCLEEQVRNFSPIRREQARNVTPLPRARREPPGGGRAAA